MSKFVEFLKKMNTTAAQYVHEMEQIIFKDPSSAIVKGRKFLEVILNDITKYEVLDEAYQTFSLYEKITYLIKDQIIDGKKIQKSFETVRMIGNKAAHHNETNEFADAFKVHKEIYNIAIWYHDLYHYTNNSDIEIPLYEPPKPQNDYQDIIQQELLQLKNKFLNILGDDTLISNIRKINGNSNDVNDEMVTRDDLSVTGREGNNKHLIEINKTDENNVELFQKNLPEGESYLIRELNRLKASSKEAIENADNFSAFKEYSHVNRPISKDLEKILDENQNKEHGNLVLLCGNVGDGKSHLLAYLNKNKPELVQGYKIFNDATESFSPDKDALATLEELLSGFSDQKIESYRNNIILAINMGVLHNFITREHEHYSYNRLKEFINESQLFTPKIQPKYTKGHFSILSFGDYNSYELTEKGAVSSFYSELLRKIVKPSDNNPFYLALQEDKKNKVHTIIHDNYRLLQNEVVQESIIQLVIQSIIIDKHVISARAFLNLIADILIPNNYNSKEYLSDLDNLEQTLPNLLFNRGERSVLLNSISKLDPLHRRSERTDQLIIELNTLSNWEKVIKNNIQDKVAIKWLRPFLNTEEETLSGYSFELFYETFVRLLYLLNKKFADGLIEDSYKDYINYLYHFNKVNKDEIKIFYEEFKKILFKWKGSPKKNYVYINKPSEKYRIAQKIYLKPTMIHLEPISDDVLQNFKTTIQLAYEEPNGQSIVTLDIDYPLYRLLYKVKNGYRPNKRDDENAIKFNEFIDKLMKFGEEKEELLVYFKADNRLYTLKKGDFGSYVFERESNQSV